MQTKIPAVVMRGGTSRALFFKREDLPKEMDTWESIFLTGLGSPDSTGRQVDGLGGGVSSTSKVAVISRSTDPRYDVTYYFGQVAIDKPCVDFVGNCGNISSAVAPFAIDEGLISATEPRTVVRIHQQNTDKLIVCEVTVTDGRFEESGNYRIPGVDGTGSKVTLHFCDPGGSLTGQLLPTGNVVDTLENIRGIDTIECSIVDAGNPFVFIRAADLGLDMNDLDQFTEVDTAATIERVRARAAVMLGCAGDEQSASIHSQAVPKIAIVSPAVPYRTMGGEMIETADTDLLIRCFSMGSLHKALPGTAAICAAGSAKIDGTIVNQVVDPVAINTGRLRFGHPSGVMEAVSELVRDQSGFHYQQATIYRTARRIMEGRILVPAPSAR